MDDALAGKLLSHAPGNEFVVAGSEQAAADGFEGEKKAGEISVLVECAGFFEGKRRVSCVSSGALAQVDEGLRGDRALEVQVKLRLGKAAKKGCEFGLIVGGHSAFQLR